MTTARNFIPMLTLKNYLRILFIDVNSTSIWGRSVQRFRLVGLPSIPVVIVVAVCAWQLVSYRKTIAGYRGMYDRAKFRYTVAQLIAKLDDERAAFVREILLQPSDSTR